MKPINLRDLHRMYHWVRSGHPEDRDHYEELAKPAAAAIMAAEKRSRVRTITVGDMLKALDEIEQKLDIPRKSMVGIIAEVDVHAQHFPSAYKGRPESTQFRAEFRRDHWVLTDVRRDDVKAPSSRHSVTLTDEAKRAIIARHESFM